MPLLKKLSVLLLLLGVLPLARAQEPTEGGAVVIAGPQTPGLKPAPPAEPTLMSNDSILRMHQAGLADDLILQTIAAQPGLYTTTPDALIALKQAGLADAILTAMANKSRHPLPAAAPASYGPVELPLVNDPGVYYKDRRGAWVPMESEIVHIKSGGFIKSHLTNGIIREDRNGAVSGRESKLALALPTEFLIYTLEGVEGSDFDVLRFRLNSKDREFRTLTGGVFHSTGGAQRDEVPFQPKRIAPRTYTFTLGTDIGGGEFGILPPGIFNVTKGC